MFALESCAGDEDLAILLASERGAELLTGKSSDYGEGPCSPPRDGTLEKSLSCSGSLGIICVSSVSERDMAAT
jgi:hypothetical protein